MKKQIYKTISKSFDYEIDKIKGSRFIAYAIPIKDEDDFKLELNKIRKKYHDARHHCYAYIIGDNDNANFKYSDDGEPSKTAGLPIYNVLKGSGLRDILVVVIRYFGGTKLGTGGLVKAYTLGAQAVLEYLDIVEIEIKTSIKVKFSYDLTKQIYHLMSNYDAKAENEEYGNDVLFTINMNIAFIDDFKAELIEKTDGKAVII